MGKRLAALLAGLSMVLAGCQAAGQDLAGVVNMEGSTSLADVMSVLQETFRAVSPEITVNYSGTGSGAGIQAVLSGTGDIGLSSRNLTDEEVRRGAVGHLLALDGVAVVVHPSNPVQALTRDQLAQIFTGEIGNWAQVGGEDLPIAVMGREAGSGTRGAFEELLEVTDRCRYKNEYGSTGDVIASASSNPNAIGYASLAVLSEAVAALEIDGVPCTEETVRDGSYPLQRPFLLVTRSGAALPAPAARFLQYALGPDAAAYITAAGAVPP